jgi:PAS domain S-box-containing protein
MRSVPVRKNEFPLLDLLSDGVLKVDAHWKIEYINPAAGRLLRIATGESYGHSFFDVCAGLPSDFKERALTADNTTSCIFEPPGSDKCLQIEATAVSGTETILQIRDLTPTKRVESALEANREFLQAVLDNVQAGIVACDENGTLKLFNDATRKLHGLTEAPVPPEQWSERYDLYQPDGVTPLSKEEIPLYRAFSGEIVKNVEMVIAPRNGPRRTILASGRALKSRHGRKLGAVVAMHDITHRKISTRRVRDALRQFRTLFNDAPIAYHEIDRTGTIRRVNRAECRLLEQTHAQMIGRPAWEFVPEAVREAARTAILEKLQGMRSLEPIECEYLTVSGKRVLVELHENHISDSSGAIVGIRTAMLDITDRKRREQQAQALVRETAARQQAEAVSAELKNILERIGDAYIAFDTEWRYTYVNRRAAELARKPASELIGRNVWEEFPEAVHTRFFSELQRSMREQIPVDFLNHFTPLGKWFENTVYPSPSGVSVFYRDITERVRTQRALERRTAQLARKNAELETFASVASHDLQEPLRMIGGYAKLLERKFSGSLDDDTSEFLRYINQGVDRMQRLIRDLLTLSRLGAVAEDLQEVSLALAIERVCANLDITINETGAVIHHQELPIVRFNETRMMQLMQNLIGNALRYRGEAKPEVVIKAERDDSVWRISVSDNGQGFDASYARQIFEPFKRLHRREDGGTGIGLAICQKIVEGRGGRIWAESAPSSGATFYFTVPDTMQTGE